MGLLDSLSGLLSGGGGNAGAIPQPNYIDPRVIALLSAAGAAGQSAMPTRLPTPNGAVFGNVASGLGQGLLSGQTAYGNNLSNYNAQQKIQLLQDVMGGAPGQSGAAAPAQAPVQPSVPAPPAAPPQTSAAPQGGLLSGNSGGGPPAPSPPPPTMLAPQGQGGANNPLGLTRQQLLGSMVSDMFGKTAGDIYSKQFPGPTELTRAYTDWQNSSPEAKPLYQQKLLTSLGDRFQLMRNGWAFDKVENKWMHMPSLGEGVTGTMDAQGNLQASPVPGAQQAISGLAGAKTGAEKSAEAGVALGDMYRPSGGAAGPTATPILPGKGSVSKGPPTPGINAPIASANGTQIPPISDAAPLSNAPAYLEKRIPQWAETENKWADAMPSNYIAEQRGLAIADALKKTESGAWATEKASVAASLKSIGIDLPSNILGDPAQVQRALKDNFAQTLAQIRGFTSRPAAAEVILGQKNFSNPDLQPEANLAILGETVGQMRWERSLVQDYSAAKKMGWRDPQDFERAWSQINPLQGFIDKTKAEIGPLKGMPGGPGSVNAPIPKAPSYQWDPVKGLTPQ